MTDTPRPRRRTVPLLAAAGVLAVLGVGLLLARNQPGEPVAVAPLPPASPGVVSAGYLNSHWRLTAVADRRDATAIPASVDAWLELASDGELLASDGVNAINGRFVTTRYGFDVSDPITTLAAHGGDDPGQLAAIAGIEAMTTGPVALSSAPDAVSVVQPMPVTVLSADREGLDVQAGGVRLTFVRNGPADRVNRTPLPHRSSTF